MTICVIYPQVSAESAIALAKKMGWDAVNPFREGKRDFRKYLGVFNYGCNRKIAAQNVLNKATAVATCIDKVATFNAFVKAGVPTVAFTTRKQDVPKTWDAVVIREKVNGAKAEGLKYAYQGPGYGDLRGPIPDGALFTELFEHTHELRVVVFCGKVVGCYRKEHAGGGLWDFIPHEYSLPLNVHAITAATALDIDYVGFDILVNNKGAYVFLEANSGPVLTDDVADAIKGYLK
jgi:hypothetical protein